MDLHMDREDRQPALVFVPETWLAEFEAGARDQVRRAQCRGFRWWLGRRRVGVTAIGGTVVLAVCVLSVLWAVAAGAVAAWLIGGFWFVAAVGLSVLASFKADAFVDWAARS